MPALRTVATFLLTVVRTVFFLAATLRVAVLVAALIAAALAAGFPNRASAQSGVRIVQGSGPALDAAALVAVHHESFTPAGPAGEAPFGGSLTIGADGVWRGALSGGRYRLANDTDPGAVRYFYIRDLADVPHAPAAGAVSVVIEGEYGELPGAGLVYRLDETSGAFYAFGLTGGRGYAVYRSDAEGFAPVMSGDAEPVRPGGPNRLTVVPDGSAVHFFVNGTAVGSVDDPAHRGGAVGIFGAGTGDFAFDDFVIYAPAPIDPVSGSAPELGVRPGFAGTFRDDVVSVTLEPAPAGELHGRIETGGRVYPVMASPDGATISGMFEADGASFEFHAALDGGRLLFTTGGANYTLDRVDP